MRQISLILKCPSLFISGALVLALTCIYHSSDSFEAYRSAGPLLPLENFTKDGKPVLRGIGSAVWSTDSIGRLAFLDNILSFFIIEVDETGNFSSKDRELK